MQTENLVRGPRGPGSRGVSAALEERMPVDWLLTDSQGQPAELSTAGYVLHFGFTGPGPVYQLLVAGAAPGSVPPQVRLTSVPAFLKRTEGSDLVSHNGRVYRATSFRVQPPISRLRSFRKAYEVLWGELEIECDSGTANDKLTLCCPVVARMPWTVGVCLLLLLGAFGGWVLGQGFGLFLDWWTEGTGPWAAGGSWWVDLQRRPVVWLFSLAGALVNLVVERVAHQDLLRQWSQELEERYHQRFEPTGEEE